jgi:hypothetical protein
MLHIEGTTAVKFSDAAKYKFLTKFVSINVMMHNNFVTSNQRHT